MMFVRRRLAIAVMWYHTRPWTPRWVKYTDTYERVWNWSFGFLMRHGR